MTREALIAFLLSSCSVGAGWGDMANLVGDSEETSAPCLGALAGDTVRFEYTAFDANVPPHMLRTNSFQLVSDLRSDYETKLFRNDDDCTSSRAMLTLDCQVTNDVVCPAGGRLTRERLELDLNTGEGFSNICTSSQCYWLQVQVEVSR